MAEGGAGEMDVVIFIWWVDCDWMALVYGCT